MDLVIDTESSVDPFTGYRRLLAVAYATTHLQTDVEIVYIDHADTNICDALNSDTKSFAIHGVDACNLPSPNMRPRLALKAIFDYCTKNKVRRVMAHGVIGDVALLVSEAVWCGLDPVQDIPQCFLQTFCTRNACRTLCAIPLPKSIQDRSRQLGTTPQQTEYKWPSLSEACLTLDVLKKAMPRPHDVKHDVECCRQLFHRLQS